MTIEQARIAYEDLRAKYETRLAAAGLRNEWEIYLEDDEFEQTTDESRAVSIEIDVLIFTDNISRDDGYGCCAISDIKDGYISESSLKRDVLEFEETLDAFIDEVLSTGDAESVIKRENETAEKEAEEILHKFEGEIKKSNTVALITAGICVAVAAVALIVRFLI